MCTNFLARHGTGGTRRPCSTMVTTREEAKQHPRAIEALIKKDIEYFEAPGSADESAEPPVKEHRAHRAKKVSQLQGKT